MISGIKKNKTMKQSDNQGILLMDAWMTVN